MNDDEHLARIRDHDHPIHVLGVINGIVVTNPDDEPGARLFIHGSKQSCMVAVGDQRYVEGIAQAAVQLGDALGDDD